MVVYANLARWCHKSFSIYVCISAREQFLLTGLILGVLHVSATADTVFADAETIPESVRAIAP